MAAYRLMKTREQQGAIFFRLENEGGREQYTKNGNFTLDANGFLTSSAGALCLDSNGQRIALAKR